MLRQIAEINGIRLDELIDFTLDDIRFIGFEDSKTKNEIAPQHFIKLLMEYHTHQHQQVIKLKEIVKDFKRGAAENWDCNVRQRVIERRSGEQAHTAQQIQKFEQNRRQNQSKYLSRSLSYDMSQNEDLQISFATASIDDDFMWRKKVTQRNLYGNEFLLRQQNVKNAITRQQTLVKKDDISSVIMSKLHSRINQSMTSEFSESRRQNMRDSHQLSVNSSKVDYSKFKERGSLNRIEEEKHETMRDSVRSSRRAIQKELLRKTINKETPTPGGDIDEKEVEFRYSHREIDVEHEMERGKKKGDCEGCQMF